MTDVTEVALVLCRGRSVLMRQYDEGERWAGLWDFPRFRAEPDVQTTSQVPANVKELTGVDVLVNNKLTSIKHGVTRFRITLDCYEAEFDAGRTKRGSGCKWVTISSLHEFPLSVTGRKIAKLIQ